MKKAYMHPALSTARLDIITPVLTVTSASNSKGDEEEYVKGEMNWEEENSMTLSSTSLWDEEW